MSQEGVLPPRSRGPRERRDRQDRGKKIVVRVNDEEHKRVLELAGTMSVSELVRRRVLGGRAHVHPALRQVAALHRVGRELQRLADKKGMPMGVVLATLERAADAIDAIARQTHDEPFEDERAP